MATFRSIWTKFWGLLQSNADKLMMLALALLLLWFLLLLITFRAGWLTLGDFRAYAVFGTAVGTTALALATVYMVRQNRELVKQNRIMLQANRIREIILCVINPLLTSIHRQKDVLEPGNFGMERLRLSSDSERGRKQEELNDIPIDLFRVESDEYRFPKQLELSRIEVYAQAWSDFKRLSQETRSICTAIEKYNNMGSERERLKRLILELWRDIRSQEFDKIVEGEVSSLQFEPGEMRLWCTELAIYELLTQKEADEASSPYPGPPRTFISQFWGKKRELLMGDVLSSENIRQKATEIIRLSNQLMTIVKDLERKLSEMKDNLRVEYNFTHEETEAKGTPYLV